MTTDTHHPPFEPRPDVALPRDRGFTLVELLIVIVVLGLLAGVTVFAVSGLTSRGRSTACESDKRTISVAIESYLADEESYPASIDDLVTGGYIREPSDYYSVGANGTISPLPGSSCT